jgi:dynein heavy chain
MLGYRESTWDEGGSTVVIDFISGIGPKTLSVCSNNNKVTLACDETGQEVKMKNLCAYFLRPSTGVITKETVCKEIQFGSVGDKGLSMNTLKRVMEGFVEKQVAHNPELSGHFHRCMANLTDTVHHADGTTVLYCPTFDYQNVPEAAQDKERLQIMESVVIHWTRQIKEVVNNHDSSASAETAGPLDEIEFWKGRAHDFVGIQRQLEGEGVRRIIEVLQYAKSSYIGPFQTLTQQIVARAAEANDNLKYLESIRDQCTALRTIEAEKVVQILPDLMNRIRLIWSFSAFYNDNDRVCGILRKISNEIIRRFRSHVPVSEILDGDVEFSMDRLHEAIHCGVEWKAIFHKTVESIKRQKVRYGRVWEIDDASVFAQIDAFVQRCRDLIEICENQMQFVRKTALTKGKPGGLPHFGGTKVSTLA